MESWAAFSDTGSGSSCPAAPLPRCPAFTSRHRRRLRVWPPRVFPPQRDGQGNSAAAHGDVGHVEGRPAERTDADIEEIHHPARASDAIDEIADRSTGAESPGQLAKPTADRAGARHPREDEHRYQRHGEEDPAGVGTD